MSCHRCANTRIRVDRSTRTITAGQTANATATIQSDLPAYYEPLVTDYASTELGRVATRRALIVVEDRDIDPVDKIIDLGDSNREYTIIDYKKFRGSHLELQVEEVKFGN